MFTLKKFFVTGFAASMLVAGAQSALALSCLQPSLANSYDRWAKSETRYVIARGVLTPAEKLPVKRNNSVEEQHIKSLKPVSYVFTGVLIGKHRNTNISTRVIVEPRCLAVWCGGYPQSGEAAIYAFETSEGGYRFSPGPCGGNAFWGDLKTKEEFVRDCMKNGGCSS